MGPGRGNMGSVPKLQCSFLQETDKYLGLNVPFCKKLTKKRMQKCLRVEGDYFEGL